MRHGSQGRGGFTLIEVVVALAVSGVVLLAARAMAEQLAEHATRVSVAAVDGDARANGERTLRAIVARLEVGTDRAGAFTGMPRAARFTSWCDVPAGWQEQCDVMLAVGRPSAIAADVGGDSNDASPGAPLGPSVLALLLAPAFDSAGVATRVTAEAIVLRRDVRVGSLLYLAEAAEGGRWLREWGSGITAPVAIGVVLDGDTLIVRIGERG